MNQRNNEDTNVTNKAFRRTTETKTKNPKKISNSKYIESAIESFTFER